MKRFAVVLLLLPLLLFAGWSRAAVPTVDAVQAEVRAGRHAQAESMMQEVVAERPKSAKAHYVYAEILAHNGRTEQALKQAREARRLDPAIGFTEAAKFERFEQQLQARLAAPSGTAAATRVGNDGTVVAPSLDNKAATTPAVRTGAAAGSGSGSSGLPSWLWIVALAALGFVAWRFMAARRNAASASMAGGLQQRPPMAGGYPGAPGTMPMQGGVAPGYGQQPMQPGAMGGRGPGLMGVGLGVAGGVAAGMLAERMLHGNEAQAHPAPDAAAQGGGGGGLEPGLFDNPAAGGDPFQDRPVDFGSGGNDWGDGGGGGSVDAGSDGGGGDGW